MPKVAIVTGASRGIGKAIACRLAHEGWSLAIQSTSASKESLMQLANELSGDVRVKPFCCDFSECISSNGGVLKSFLASVIAAFGRVDALVNNAGVISDVSVETVGVDELQRVFEINTYAPFLLSQGVFCQMKAQGAGGRIVNISSFTVRYGMGRNQSIQYAASKSAIETLTIGLSRLGAAHQIVVNAIRPGLVNTEQQQGRSGMKARIQRVPLNRMAESDEIAGAVSYFLSESSAFVTGQVLSVSGGE